VVLVAVSGFFQAAASTARGLTVTDALPASSWPVGFSVLYSCAAVGFTVASGVSAMFLVTNSAAVLMIALAIVAIVIFMLTGWREHARMRT
jgi:hypothetical protein